METLNMQEVFEQLNQLVEQGDTVGLEKVVNKIITQLQSQLSGDQFANKEKHIRNRFERVKKLMEMDAPALILENELKLLKDEIK